MRRMVIFSLSAMLLLTALACQKPSDEGQIRKVIATVQKAGEEKNVRDVMDHLSKAYSDPRGFNHDGIRGLLAGYFLRYPKISVYITHLDVSVEGDTAQATFQAVLTSQDQTGSLTDLIPQSLGVWDFSVGFAKESGTWKVIRAEWTQGSSPEARY